MTTPINPVSTITNGRVNQLYLVRSYCKKKGLCKKLNCDCSAFPSPIPIQFLITSL